MSLVTNLALRLFLGSCEVMLSLITLSGTSSSEENAHLSGVLGGVLSGAFSASDFVSTTPDTGTGCFIFGSSVFHLCTSILLCDGPDMGITLFDVLILGFGDTPRSRSE